MNPKPISFSAFSGRFPENEYRIWRLRQRAGMLRKVIREDLYDLLEMGTERKMKLQHMVCYWVGDEIVDWVWKRGGRMTGGCLPAFLLILLFILVFGSVML